jgi:hypothetical protein
MADYNDYLTLKVPPQETFEYDELQLINNSDSTFHLFLKKLEPQEIYNVDAEFEMVEEVEPVIDIHEFQQALDLDHCPAVRVDNFEIVK